MFCPYGRVVLKVAPNDMQSASALSLLAPYLRAARKSALEIDLRRWFEQPDAGSLEALREAREALLFSRAALTLPFPL